MSITSLVLGKGKDGKLALFGLDPRFSANMTAIPDAQVESTLESAVDNAQTEEMRSSFQRLLDKWRRR